jgi:hypothetical protein
MPRSLLPALALVGCLGAVQAFALQVELDRVVGRIHSRVVTKSDVQQARVLQLLANVSSDQAAQEAFIDRLLLLQEIERSAGLPPASDADLAARRAQWEARVGGPDKSSALMKSGGMNDAALQAWWRDDLRIDAYLRRQFGGLPADERERATADLVRRLRQRAGIP